MKFIQSIAILLISVALQFGCCSQSDKLAEILKYCHNNGHKYVSILGDDASQFKPYSLLLNSIDIRGRFVNLDNFDTLVGSLDFLIAERGKSLTFAKILKIMNERNIQESLLVINEEEVQEFKVRVYLSNSNNLAQCNITYYEFLIQLAERQEFQNIFVPCSVHSQYIYP